MQYISKSAFIAFRVVVVLAIVRAHLHVSLVNVSSMLSLLNVLSKGSTRAQTWNFSFSHSLPFGLDQDVQSSHVSFTLDLLLSILPLSLDAALNSLNVTLKPPLFLEFLQLLLTNRLLSSALFCMLEL